MTTTADQPADLTAVAAAVPAPRSGTALTTGLDGPVVTVLGQPTRRTASELSCRLHEAIAGAAAGAHVLVDLGAASAADPGIERVLVCARERATCRGLGFAVR